VLVIDHVSMLLVVVHRRQWFLPSKPSNSSSSILWQRTGSRNHTLLSLLRPAAVAASAMPSCSGSDHAAAPAPVHRTATASL
jgi:hypothetical protein